MTSKLDVMKNIADWLIRGWAVGTILWFVLSYFNIMPFYQAKLIKVDSVTPAFSLIPGTQIRLGIDSYDNSLKNEIAAVEWTLSKGKNVFKFEGLEPTIILPPTESGLFQLKIVVTMLDGRIKTGESSIYVVQDKPITVKLSKPILFQLTDNNTNKVLLSKFRSPESIIEVYSGNEQWIKAEKISTTDNNITFEVKPNSTISSFNNRIVIRIKGDQKNLGNYNSIQIPLGVIKPKNP